MQNYPSLNESTLPAAISVLQFMIRQRKSDVTDWNNLPQVFGQGRKVGRLPSSSADVIDGDKLGDFNITNAYRYDLVSDGVGGSKWVRTASATW